MIFARIGRFWTFFIFLKFSNFDDVINPTPDQLDPNGKKNYFYISYQDSRPRVTTIVKDGYFFNVQARVGGHLFRPSLFDPETPFYHYYQ